MELNYTLAINDAETKGVIKNIFKEKDISGFCDSVTFKSMEFSDNAALPASIRISVKTITSPVFLLEFGRHIETQTGRKARFIFEFDPAIPGEQILENYWQFFISEFDAEKAWLDYAEPEAVPGLLKINCMKDIVFSNLGDKKTYAKLKSGAREFTGRETEIGLVIKINGEQERKAIPVVTNIEVSEAKNTLSKILKAEDIKGEVTLLENINNKGKYVIEGRVFIGDEKEYKKDKTGRDGEAACVIYFYITDEKETMKFSCWLDKEDALADGIKEIKYAKVQAEIDYFPGETELTGRVKKMEVIPGPEAVDTALEKRVELHAHTRMSQMDATTSIEELLLQAEKWGHPAVAITDHGVVHAYPEAFNRINDKAHPVKIKLILGMEGYLVEKYYKPSKERSTDEVNQKPFHIIILVKNRAGLKNLYRLVSMSHLDYFYKKPRIPREKLLENREGLIFGSACYMGELYQAVLAGKPHEELKKIGEFYDYFEIQPNENNRFLVREGAVKDEEGLNEINRKICALGEELGRPVVATGDVHFLRSDHRIYREVLMSAQGYDEIGETATADLSFRTTDNMMKEFSYLGEEKAAEVVVKNTRKISEMIEANIRPVPKNLHPPSIENSDNEIKDSTWQRAAEIYGENIPEIIKERIDRELGAIIGNKYSVLYLIAKKMVEKSKSDGYIVGSRGSVGSSLVAFLCGISEVNPMPPHYVCKKCQHSQFLQSELLGPDLPDAECPICGEKLLKDGYDIPFETFMGFKGEKIPDIDLNFSGEYQDRIHKFIVELFGADKVYRAGTIGTVQEAAVRKDYLSKYEERKKVKLKDAEKMRLAIGCSGVKRSTGQHAGGLMLVPQANDIYDFTPVQNPPNDKETITTHFDYEYIHDALVKIDALGHDLPTSLKRLCEELKMKVDDIPLDDSDAVRIFSGVTVLGVDPKNYSPPIGTLGIPEYGTQFTRGMLAITRPKTLSELVYIMGLSHGTNVWKGNAEDLIKSKKAVLKEVISVRDDIMNFLISKGLPKEVSFAITESVRKGRSVTKEQEIMMKKHKVPDWYIDSCKKIKYMFPKAHAVAYAIMAVRLAYMKVHHPLYFYADYFNREKEGFEYEFAFLDKKKLSSARRDLEMAVKKENGKKEKDQFKVIEVVYEMKERGFDFLNINLYESDPQLFMVKDGKIIMPLTIVPDLGEKVAEAICRERAKGRFKSIEDLVKRTKVNKNVAEFIQANALAPEMPATDQVNLF